MIVDHNKLQSDTWVDAGQRPRRPRGARCAAFGWAVGALRRATTCAALAATLEELRRRERAGRSCSSRDTLKGARRLVHGAARRSRSRAPRSTPSTRARPTPEAYERGARRSSRRGWTSGSRGSGAGAVELVSARAGAAPGRRRRSPQRLVARLRRGARRAGGARAAARRARRRPRARTPGWSPFRERFPERFFECGIAEQDMVSQAGAMALAGLLPVVPLVRLLPLDARRTSRSTTTRPRGRRSSTLGSLAGLVPGGPGPLAPVRARHRAARARAGHGADRAVLRGTRSGARVEWAVREAPGPVYLRLV